MDLLGGHGPPTLVLFSKDVCENERIWSHRGACAQHTPPRSTNGISSIAQLMYLSIHQKQSVKLWRLMFVCITNTVEALDSINISVIIISNI